MSFKEFEQAIASPGLKRVANHWNEARGANRMPSWKAIQPKAIAAQLPLVWVYDYNRAAKQFTGRLSGDQIDRMFGKNLKGVPMSDLYPAAYFQRLFDRSKRCVCEPALYRGEGIVFRHLDRYGQGERIMLPLARDGQTGDGILGATKYQTMVGRPTVNMEEVESWFLV